LGVSCITVQLVDEKMFLIPGLLFNGLKELQSRVGVG